MSKNQRLDLFDRTLKQTKEFAEKLRLNYLRIWEAEITRYETIKIKKLIK